MNPQSWVTHRKVTENHRPKMIAASYRSGQRQVHGIDYTQLTELLDATRTLTAKTAATLLRAAYNLAWFGKL